VGKIEYAVMILLLSHRLEDRTGESFRVYFHRGPGRRIPSTVHTQRKHDRHSRWIYYTRTAIYYTYMCVCVCINFWFIFFFWRTAVYIRIQLTYIYIYLRAEKVPLLVIFHPYNTYRYDDDVLYYSLVAYVLLRRSPFNEIILVTRQN